TVARARGRRDVLIAVVDSGRGVPGDGVIAMIGMLAGTTARRVDGRGSTGDALRSLAAQEAATASGPPPPLTEVQALLGEAAVDTVVAIDNQARTLLPGHLPGGLRVVGSGGVQSSGFPVVLHVVTTPELRVEVQYDGDVVD